MAYRVFIGDVGDPNPNAAAGQSDYLRDQDAPEGVDSAQTLARAAAADGLYVIVVDDVADAIVIRAGNVPSNVQRARKRPRESGFRVDIAALAGDAVPRGAWFDIRDLQLRIDAAGTAAEFRFAHREDDGS